MPRPKPATDAVATVASAKPALKKGWQWVRFGEVVQNVKATCSNPAEAGLERYVGLEHLEPRDLRIRSWGNIADGTTFNRVFRTGQVLFGKRRAYQRKAAVADFDGLCSGDIYVFAANEERLVPELLPFLVQTEEFATHAESTSEGSLSPRTKWKYLAEYEFALPSDPAEQRRIAELLRAAETVPQQYQNTLTAIDDARDAMVEPEDVVARGVQPLQNYTTLIIDGEHNPPKRVSSGVPYALVQNVVNGGLDLQECSYISREDFERTKRRFTAARGDILLVCVGFTTGRVSYVDRDEEFAIDRSVAAIRFDIRLVLPEYGFALMGSAFVQQQVRKSILGTQQLHLYLRDIKKLKVAVPPIPVQEHILDRLKQMGEARGSIETALAHARAVKHNLMETLLRTPSCSTSSTPSSGCA